MDGFFMVKHLRIIFKEYFHRKIRQRMARERRGVESSVVSMEILY